MKFFLGLDLGQASDYTALAVLEKLDPAPAADTRGRGPGLRLGEALPLSQTLRGRAPAPAIFHCRHLERMPLGTAYPAVVRHVRELLATPPLRGDSALVVDATGVSRPVVDMLTAAGLEPISVTITGGDAVTQETARSYRVPKRDLVSVVQVLLQSERLKFAAQLPLVETLKRELQDFRVKIDPVTAHDSYGSWREGSHDDLVLAVAVAAWYGERWQARPLYTSFSYVTPG